MSLRKTLRFANNFGFSAALLYSVLKPLTRIVKRTLPDTRLTDRFLCWSWFFLRHGRFPLRQKSFNDALLRIKASDEALNPVRTFTSDKEFVKIFVCGVVGDVHNVKTLAILRSPEEVQSFPFPERCVIKPSHTSGQVILRRAGEPLDRAAISRWFQMSYYTKSREVNYRYLTPKVIVEDFVFDRDSADDLKLFCFEGKVRIIQWDCDRHTRHTRRLYDRNWNPLPIELAYPAAPREMERPKSLEQLIGVAEKLAAFFSLVRVDLYLDDANGRICVGEITHCHGGAFSRFASEQEEAHFNRILFGES